MLKKEERLKNLANENFYFSLIDGTLMPNAPRYTKITMFDDIFIQKMRGLQNNI